MIVAKRTSSLGDAPRAEGRDAYDPMIKSKGTVHAVEAIWGEVLS